MLPARRTTVTGNYTIQAVDANGTVLGRQGFTPTFVDLSNPPEDLDMAPFTRVIVPFPEGTVKFRIVDQDSVIRSEVPVSVRRPDGRRNRAAGRPGDIRPLHDNLDSHGPGRRQSLLPGGVQPGRSALDHPAAVGDHDQLCHGFQPPSRRQPGPDPGDGQRRDTQCLGGQRGLQGAAQGDRSHH